MLNAPHLAMHFASFGPNDPRGAQCIPQPRAPILFAPTRNLLLVTGTPKPPPSSSIASLSITRACHRARGGAGSRSADPYRQATSRALPYTHSSRSHIVVCGVIYVPACTYRATCCRLGRVSMAGPVRDFRCCHHRRPHSAEWRWDVEAELPEPALRSISLSVSSLLLSSQ